MNFFDQIGKIAIGSRLRMLTEKITADATQLYQLYGVELQPKWFPVFYALSKGEAKTVTVIAKEIGHSHPSVSKIVSEMHKHGLLEERRDESDKRRNVVALSPKGLEMNEKIQYQYQDVNAALDEILAQSQYDLWKAIAEWEFLLEQRSLFRRVQDQRKSRESKAVQIVEYSPQYRQAFRDLNVEWISKYFVMEEADYRALDDPEGYILEKGGYIFIALYEGEPLGVCALAKMPADDPTYDYELAKMAVSPKAQGKHLGYLLGQAVLDKARSLGARAVFLESNTLLKPALSLYQKLGFVKVTGRPSPYERANIQMGIVL